MVHIRTALLSRTWVVLMAAVFACADSMAGENKVSLPRYQLEPGMVLTYRGRAKLKVGKENFLEEMDTTAYVVKRNPDRSWRIVVSVASRMREAPAPGTENAKGEARALGGSLSLGYFDLYADGRIGSEAEIGPSLDPAIAFPRLSGSGETKDWKSNDLRTGEEYSYSSLRCVAGGWTFHAERTGPWKAVYGTTFSSFYHFDRGMVLGAEQVFSQKAGASEKGFGKVELKSVETKDAAWLAEFAPAADRFIQAQAAYKKTVRAAAKDAANCQTLLVDARSKLQAARDATQEPIFRKEFDRALANHDAKAKSYLASAQKRATVVGKPSPVWTLLDLDGKQHSLEDYRGKVVVLDFWFRNCGWCVKAMPEVNTLAQQFAGRPVVVLGMNTDAMEQDAKFVASTMGLKYETLRAQGIPEKYGVPGFPTVIVIGPDGIVRDMQAGYSPTMAADIARTIEELLKRKE